MNYKLIITLLFGSSLYLYADTWANPEKKDYYSDNGLYMLRVFPRDIPDNYSKWRVAKPKKKHIFSAKDTTMIPYHAILYNITDSDTVEIWNKKLINIIAPVVVIVANDGNSVVTFDNWYTNGYGLDVMVVYDKNGGLTNRFD